MIARFFRHDSGAAAVEMALVTPLLLIIMFGSVEAGNYFLDEHSLVKAVRDGARYAARQSFTNYDGCGDTDTNVPTAVSDNAKLIARKGSLNSADPDLLPNWGSATFSVTMRCPITVGSYTPSGIYDGNNVGRDSAAPVVTVTVQLPYRPVLQSFGFSGTGFNLNASEQAAVMGI